MKSNPEYADIPGVHEMRHSFFAHIFPIVWNNKHGITLTF